MKDIKLDFEVADRIALASLKSSRKIIKRELKLYYKGKMQRHLVDVERDERMLRALDLVINYYGG